MTKQKVQPVLAVQCDSELKEKSNWLDSHESGYSKHLKKRHVQMMALGGAIGTGLFLGAGARLQIAGPAHDVF